MQQGTFAESIVGTQLSATGTFKNFYDNGTNHGSYKLSGPVGTGTITASGSVKVTGGTGAYKNMKGTGVDLHDNRRRKDLRLHDERDTGFLTGREACRPVRQAPRA